jgi:ribosomal protein S18 acetylase RimI-like enzyme
MNEALPTISLEREPSYFITPACPEDALGIRSVEKKAWLATYTENSSGITQDDIAWYFKKYKPVSPEGLEKLRTSLEQKNDGVFVAKDESGTVVGFVWCLKNQNGNELGAIYISPSIQGNGLGKKLFEEAKNFFDPTKEIRVTVESHNTKAMGFYKRLGFRETGKLLDSGLHFPSGATFIQREMLRNVETPTSISSAPPKE